MSHKQDSSNLKPLPGTPPEAIDLVRKTLKYVPSNRMTAAEACVYRSLLHVSGIRNTNIYPHESVPSSKG